MAFPDNQPVSPSGGVAYYGDPYDRNNYRNNVYAYNDGNKPLLEGAHSELETVLFHEIRITYKRSKCKSAYVLKVLIVLFWTQSTFFSCEDEPQMINGPCQDDLRSRLRILE